MLIQHRGKKVACLLCLVLVAPLACYRSPGPDSPSGPKRPNGEGAVVGGGATPGTKPHKPHPGGTQQGPNQGTPSPAAECRFGKESARYVFKVWPERPHTSLSEAVFYSESEEEIEHAEDLFLSRRLVGQGSEGRRLEYFEESSEFRLTIFLEKKIPNDGPPHFQSEVEYPLFGLSKESGSCTIRPYLLKKLSAPH